MFALVALLCFYSGINNISKAFRLAPFSRWAGINWILFVLGVVLLIVGCACVWQANKDLQEKKARDMQKAQEEKEKRQRQFFYDREDDKPE